MSGDGIHVRRLVTVAVMSAACALADEPEVALYGTVAGNPFLTALDELGVVARVAPIAKLRDGPVDSDGVIVVAGQYPQTLALGDAEWRTISGYLERGANVYVEYAYVPGWTVGKPRQMGYDRIVVPEAAARSNLPGLTILEEHQSHRLTLALP